MGATVKDTVGVGWDSSLFGRVVAKGVACVFIEFVGWGEVDGALGEALEDSIVRHLYTALVLGEELGVVPFADEIYAIVSLKIDPGCGKAWCEMFLNRRRKL